MSKPYPLTTNKQVELVKHCHKYIKSSFHVGWNVSLSLPLIESANAGSGRRLYQVLGKPFRRNGKNLPKKASEIWEKTAQLPQRRAINRKGIREKQTQQEYVSQRCVFCRTAKR